MEKLDTIDKQTVLSLALLGLKSNLQKIDISSTIIKLSFIKVKELGYSIILILGRHPKYYKRFGFVPANNYGLKWCDGTEIDAFQALELEKGSFGRTGTIGNYLLHL